MPTAVDRRFSICLLSCLALAGSACGSTERVIRAPPDQDEPGCSSAEVLPAIVVLVDGLARSGGGNPATSTAALDLLTSTACRSKGAGALAFLAEVHMARRMIEAQHGQRALVHLERAIRRSQTAGYGPAVDRGLRRLQSEAYEVLGQTFRAAGVLEDDPWLDRLIEQNRTPQRR